MHEASVAQSIVNTILGVALRGNAQKVLRVEMEIGEICLVNVEQLIYLIDMFTHDTIAKDMKTSVNEVKTQIRCNDCSYLGGVEYKEVDPSWHYRVPIFDCVQCKSNKTEIVKGKELKIKTIDVSF